MSYGYLPRLRRRPPRSLSHKVYPGHPARASGVLVAARAAVLGARQLGAQAGPQAGPRQTRVLPTTRGGPLRAAGVPDHPGCESEGFCDLYSNRRTLVPSMQRCASDHAASHIGPSALLGSHRVEGSSSVPISSRWALWSRFEVPPVCGTHIMIHVSNVCVRKSHRHAGASRCSLALTLVPFVVTARSA